MSSSVDRSHVVMFSLLVLVSALCSSPSSAQSAPTFSLHTTFAKQYAAGTYAADLNGDGIPDLIETYSRINAVLFSVQIGKGDGTFAAPVHYSPPVNQQFAVVVLPADVNKDGKFDLVVLTGKDLLVYLGHGDGTFAAPLRATLPGIVGFAAMADFNHDGNGDLALYLGDSNSVVVAFGDGKGHFLNLSTVKSLGPSQSVESLALGDFDADGNADIALSVANAPCSPGGCASADVHILYGSQSGTFTDNLSYKGLPSDLFFSSGDLNQDGRTDLVGFADLLKQNILVLYGSSSRKLSVLHLKANGLAFNSAFYTAPVADFNGDGRNDFVVQVLNAANQQAFDIFLRNPDGTFALKKEVVLGQDTFEIGDLVIADFNRDEKPDFLVAAKNDSLPTQQLTKVYDYLNATSAQHFASCSYPSSPTGIHTCLHQSGANGSLVQIDVAAAWFEPLRKVELWVDGVKVQEQHNVWDKYGWLQYSHTFATGKHRAAIFTAGYDNALQSRTFTFTVN
jgi:hypothetical protein